MNLLMLWKWKYTTRYNIIRFQAIVVVIPFNDLLVFDLRQSGDSHFRSISHQYI